MTLTKYQAAKISVLSSGKTDTNEYLTGEEILSCNQKKIIEQAKFTYSPSLKASKEQAKEHVKAINNGNIFDKTD